MLDGEEVQQNITVIQIGEGQDKKINDNANYDINPDFTERTFNKSIKDIGVSIHGRFFGNILCAKIMTHPALIGDTPVCNPESSLLSIKRL